MLDATNIIEVLDAKIRELEQEAQELQRTLQRLSTVNMNLNAIRQTRALLAGTDAQKGVPPPLEPVLTGRVVPGSVGAVALEILREAGKPLCVKELLAKVRIKGKPDVAEATLVSTLCSYVTNGKVRRTAPSTYAL